MSDWPNPTELLYKLEDSGERVNEVVVKWRYVPATFEDVVAWLKERGVEMWQVCEQHGIAERRNNEFTKRNCCATIHPAPATHPCQMSQRLVVPVDFLDSEGAER